MENAKSDRRLGPFGLDPDCKRKESPTLIFHGPPLDERGQGAHLGALESGSAEAVSSVSDGLTRVSIGKEGHSTPLSTSWQKLVARRRQRAL